MFILNQRNLNYNTKRNLNYITKTKNKSYYHLLIHSFLFTIVFIHSAQKLQNYFTIQGDV